MKIISKYFYTFIFILFASVNFVHADTLADNFSVFDIFTSFTKKLENTASTTLETASTTDTTSQNTDDASSTDTSDVPKTSCEHFDNIVVNVLNLQNASEDTKQKIEKVEETINDESSFRDSILGSVKNLLGLQKKDKVIFREMKKDIADAKDYYDTLDQKVASTSDYLDLNSCEDVKVDEAKSVDDDTQNMVDDESTFRAQFAASLKEKMKILQDATKVAKK